MRPVSWTTPGASPLRQRIETSSRALLVRLHDLPRWALFGAITAVALGGALLPWWAGVPCLGLITAFVGWLLYLAWPSLTASRRAARLAAVLVLVAVTVARAIAA